MSLVFFFIKICFIKTFKLCWWDKGKNMSPLTYTPPQWTRLCCSAAFEHSVTQLHLNIRPWRWLTDAEVGGREGKWQARTGSQLLWRQLRRHTQSPLEQGSDSTAQWSSSYFPTSQPSVFSPWSASTVNTFTAALNWTIFTSVEADKPWMSSVLQRAMMLVWRRRSRKQHNAFQKQS